MVSCSNLSYTQKTQLPDRRVYGLTYSKLVDATKESLDALNLKIEKEDFDKEIIYGKDYNIKMIFISNHISAIKIEGDSKIYKSIFSNIEKITKPDMLNPNIVKW